jgi:hypothetical protein
MTGVNQVDAAETGTSFLTTTRLVLDGVVSINKVICTHAVRIPLDAGAAGFFVSRVLFFLQGEG